MTIYPVGLTDVIKETTGYALIGESQQLWKLSGHILNYAEEKLSEERFSDRIRCNVEALADDLAYLYVHTFSNKKGMYIDALSLDCPWEIIRVRRTSTSTLDDCEIYAVENLPPADEKAFFLKFKDSLKDMVKGKKN